MIYYNICIWTDVIVMYVYLFLFLGEYSCPNDKTKDLVQDCGITIVHLFVVSLNLLDCFEETAVCIFSYHSLKFKLIHQKADKNEEAKNILILHSHHHARG